jgi:hypothetical protein
VQPDVIELSTFRKQSAPRIVHTSGVGIARAVIMDPDDRLVALLRGCVREVQVLTTPVRKAAVQPAVEASLERTPTA